MKTIKIDRNSKTFRFAVSWGNWRYIAKPDICAFTRALIWGGFKVLLLAGLFLAMYSGITFSLYMALSTDGFPYPILGAFLIPPLGVAALLAVAYALIVIIMCVSEKIAVAARRRRDYKESNPKPPTALREAYRSWKGKYCAKVEVQ